MYLLPYKIRPENLKIVPDHILTPNVGYFASRSPAYAKASAGKSL